MSLICGSKIPEQSNGQLNLQVSANGPTRFLRVATCSETPGNGEQWGLSLRSIVVALLQCAHHPVLCSILSKTRGKAVSRPKEPRSPTSFAGFNSWWLSAKFRMSAEIWGGNNRSRYESKSNPSRGNAVVQLCSLSTNCP